jgi:hypothetical protein
MGEIKNGVEDMENAKTQGWAGGHENYTLKKLMEKQSLTVEMDNMVCRRICLIISTIPGPKRWKN